MAYKITYRHMEARDIDAVRRYVSSAQVTRYLTWKAYSDPDDVAAYVARSVPKSGHPDEVLVIELDGEVIGTVHLIERPGRAVQFGFGIVPARWGKGLGKQIVNDMVRYMRTTAWKEKDTVIWADVHGANSWAAGHLITGGFTHTGREVEPGRYRFTLPL